MLVNKLRLTKEKDFKRIFKKGKASYAKIFGVKALINKLEVNRYGIIISAKVSKKATERNKLKRQLRAAIKEFDEKIIHGFDLVIIVSPAALNQKYQAIESELKKLLIALKLFKPGK